MTKDEVLKLALEALEEAWYHVGTFQPTEEAIDLYDKAKTALREALAQPEQEPVAWATEEDFYRALEHELKHIREEMKIKSVTMRCKDYDVALPIIYNDFGRVLVGQPCIPPQRTWVGLTDEEIDQGLLRTNYAIQTAKAWRDGVEWAQSQLKDKNT